MLSLPVRESSHVSATAGKSESAMNSHHLIAVFNPFRKLPGLVQRHEILEARERVCCHFEIWQLHKFDEFLEHGLRLCDKYVKLLVSQALPQHGTAGQRSVSAPISEHQPLKQRGPLGDVRDCRHVVFAQHVADHLGNQLPSFEFLW